MKHFSLGLLLLLAISLLSFEKAPYSKTHVEIFIREVFADQADTLVLNSPSNRYNIIVDFLQRFEIVSMPEYAEKEFALLSSVPLMNKYNPGLRRDIVVDVVTFNPLKYQFPFYSKSKEIFRIDGTNLLIVIQPAK